MENNQNQDAQARAAANHQGVGKSGGGNRHGRRGGHHRRSSQRRQSTQENAEQKLQAVEHEGKDAAQENAAHPDKAKQQRGGDRSRSQSGRKGRGKGNAQKDAVYAEKDVTAASKEEKNEGRRRSLAKEISSEALYSPSIGGRSGLFDSLDGRHEDSFLPVHEEHRPDPEAERFAATLLDAEGPLLAQNRPVDEMPLEEVACEEPTSEEDALVEIVGIRFRTTGKVYFFDPGALKLRAGTYAVVETARGLEYGEVYRGNTMVSQKQIVPPLRPVIRAATKDDVAHYEENKAREQEAFRVCQEKIVSHNLDMKLVEAEYTFDNTKLLFYFTSAGRVDFRELVKDLAGVFRTRIELRQIGIRDEAKLLGGLGTCGRPLCCASFLADFVQVSIKMAKEQSLSLNSTKISGCCGRLMCCLRYEQDTYEEEIRRTPGINSLLNTPDGQGTVISSNPLRGTVRVRLGGEEGTIKEFHRDDVQVVRNVQPAPEE